MSPAPSERKKKQRKKASNPGQDDFEQLGREADDPFGNPFDSEQPPAVSQSARSATSSFQTEIGDDDPFTQLARRPSSKSLQQSERTAFGSEQPPAVGQPVQSTTSSSKTEIGDDDPFTQLARRSSSRSLPSERSATEDSLAKKTPQPTSIQSSLAKLRQEEVELRESITGWEAEQSSFKTKGRWMAFATVVGVAVGIGLTIVTGLPGIALIGLVLAGGIQSMRDSGENMDRAGDRVEEKKSELRKLQEKIGTLEGQEKRGKTGNEAKIFTRLDLHPSNQRLQEVNAQLSSKTALVGESKPSPKAATPEPESEVPVTPVTGRRRGRR